MFHEASSVVDILNKTKAGTVVPFRNGESVEDISERILKSGWFSQNQNAETLKTKMRKSENDVEGKTLKGSNSENLKTETNVSVSASQSFSISESPPTPATDWAAFAPYTAREMTWKLCEVFDKAQSIKTKKLKN